MRINTVNQLEKFLEKGVFYEFVGQGYLVVSRPGCRPQGGKADLMYRLGMKSPVLSRVLDILETRGKIRLGRSVKKALKASSQTPRGARLLHD